MRSISHWIFFLTLEKFGFFQNPKFWSHKGILRKTTIHQFCCISQFSKIPFFYKKKQFFSMKNPILVRFQETLEFNSHSTANLL